MTRPTAMAPDASTSPVGQWGPEIRVANGQRPEGLTNGDPIMLLVSHALGGERITYVKEQISWPHVPAFRLRGDHSLYRQPTTPELDPALWDRMVALVRRLAAHWETADPEDINGPIDEARAIVADLPKPVDPDLIEAREVCFRESLSESREDSTYLKGGLDNSLSMRCALAAIKRGRELATPEVSHVG